ncbi:MAG: quinone-dependent dihydroorotate dehydrogenase [Calditrichaeota bacterium]|nr:MAG: quinone-dependent dihydroorotate dehydrogenase [Calditrichota bacterium]
MYKMVQKILFLFDAEFAHKLGLTGLRVLKRCGLIRLVRKRVTEQPVEIMGLTFPNRVGLAAGMDKNGDYIDCLGALGFGFLELGTVTPRPQPGNPKPRLFRLVPEKAIINRMGFNNKGVDHLINQVKKSKYQGIIGINIGKNFDTPVANAVEDYRICFRKAYACADYIAVNISSPNTKNLRDLQAGDELQKLLSALKNEQSKLVKQTNRYVPFAVKIAPDLTDSEVKNIAQILTANRVDAVIATNTTISRESISGKKHSLETGGLSGEPLKLPSDALLKKLISELNNAIPVIAVGGIMSAGDAEDKFNAGAKLVQIYTGFIYKGPDLIFEILQR